MPEPIVHSEHKTAWPRQRPPSVPLPPPIRHRSRLLARRLVNGGGVVSSAIRTSVGIAPVLTDRPVRTLALSKSPMPVAGDRVLHRKGGTGRACGTVEPLRPIEPDRSARPAQMLRLYALATQTENQPHLAGGHCQPIGNLFDRQSFVGQSIDRLMALAFR